MIQILAIRITEYAVAHQWIDSLHARWCNYAIEKWLGKLIFALLFVVAAIITDSFMELFVFICTFVLFRQRQGGWHSKHFWSCQIISIGMVLLIALIIGPCLEGLRNDFVTVASLLVVGGTFALKPAYPVQLHFSKAEKQANIKRRNHLLIGLCILQCLCFIGSFSSLIVYSFLGLAIADISVLLEHIIIIRKD